MKRQKVTRYDAGNYPEMSKGMDRRRVLAGIGGFAGALAAASLGGCFPFPGIMQGDVAVSDLWGLSLPPDPDVRTLYFDDNAFIDYHVYVQVDVQEHVETIAQDREALLQLFDELLGGYSIYDLHPDEDLHDIELQLQAAVDAYYQDLGEPVHLWSLVLTVETWDEGGELPGSAPM